MHVFVIELAKCLLMKIYEFLQLKHERHLICSKVSVISMMTRFFFVLNALLICLSISHLAWNIFRHFAAFLSVCRSLVKNTLTHTHIYIYKHEIYSKIYIYSPCTNTNARWVPVFMTLSSMFADSAFDAIFALFSLVTRISADTPISNSLERDTCKKSEENPFGSILFVCILNSMNSRYSGAVFCSLYICQKLPTLCVSAQCVCICICWRGYVQKPAYYNMSISLLMGKVFEILNKKLAQRNRSIQLTSVATKFLEKHSSLTSLFFLSACKWSL